MHIADAEGYCEGVYAHTMRGTSREPTNGSGGDLSVLKETAAHGAIYAVINARKTLDAGFTTVREAGSTDYVDVVVRDAITRGLIPGPRIHAAGPALGSTGGHADVNGWSPNVAIPGTGAIVDGPAPSAVRCG